MAAVKSKSQTRQASKEWAPIMFLKTSGNSRREASPGTSGRDMCVVSIIKSTYENIQENLPRAIALAGGFQPNRKDFDKVVIKINLCDARTPDTGTITHPMFLDAVLEYVRESFGDVDVYVAESDGRVVLADYYAKWFGILPVVRKWNAHWHNLSNDACVVKRAPFWPDVELQIPKIFENSYFITLPKLKTNTLTKITCCLKNQFGCNPKLDKQVFHNQIDNAIVALNWAVGPPDFCIVDGVLGQGGIWGPSFGIPVPSEVIVAGKDAVAVDCACAKIMGFNPKRVRHLKLAAERGLGSMKFKVDGESLENMRVDFKWNATNQRLFMLAQRLRDREFKRMRS